jgi:hypothetical protein
VKVRELIAALEEVDPELEVVTQGCDCDGDVAKVSIDGTNAYLERT